MPQDEELLDGMLDGFDEDVGAVESMLREQGAVRFPIAPCSLSMLSTAANLSGARRALFFCL